MALINTTGVRQTSSRSSPGTLALHAAQVSALWLTTSTDPGTSFASRRGRLRDQQFLRGEFLHRQPAPLRRAPQQEHLYAGLRVHTFAGYVCARTPHGLLKAWLSQACSAELPTRGALFHCRQLSHQQRVRQAPTVNAVSRQFRRPSVTPASRGRQTACRFCEAPVQSLTDTSVLTVVALLCSPTRKN